MSLTHEFTSEQQARWDHWVQAGVQSGLRADRLARVVGGGLFLVLLAVVSVAVWRL